jgi:hypothetical protein
MTRIGDTYRFGYAGGTWDEPLESVGSIRAVDFAAALRDVRSVDSRDADPEHLPAQDDAVCSETDSEAMSIDDRPCAARDEALPVPEELVDAARAAVKARRGCNGASTQPMQRWRGRVANGRWEGLEFELECRYPGMDCTLHAIDGAQFHALTVVLADFRPELQRLLGCTLHVEVKHVGD